MPGARARRRAKRQAAERPLFPASREIRAGAPWDGWTTAILGAVLALALAAAFCG